MTSTGPRPLAFRAPPKNRPRAGRKRVSKTCSRGSDSFAACHAPGARLVEHRFRKPKVRVRFPAGAVRVAVRVH